MNATVSTKGHLIDPHCKYNNGTILESDGRVYSCVLNQTEIKLNVNKFYIMQIVVVGNKYVVYIRYGRIGEVGTINYNDHTSQNTATTYFEKQFRTKTGNSWYNVKKFTKKNGKYFMAEIECAEVSEEEVSEEEACDDSDDDIHLDERVSDLVKLITNVTYMKNVLVQLKIDTEKMPLGKISQPQIDKAYEILDKINKNLDDPDELISLSSEYYTLIPYSCSRRELPPIINTVKLIGDNIDLLNELSQMVFGSKAVTKLKKDKGNLLNLYQDLHTDIIPLDKTDDMYKILVEYLINSKAPTHNVDFDVMNIFEIARDHERDAYDAYSAKLKNKTLLFHGTRVSNLCGILKNGLVVDPSKLGINVNITGKMFGLGLYFANACTKSIQYCAYDSSDNIACLFVAEVALGNMLEKKNASTSLTAKTLPKGYHSTWGLGKSSFKKYDEYDDDTRIPKGKINYVSNSSDRILFYDEFIVYREEQINLRYIILLKIIE
jgi:predicted DNA-binding WGR domain protein